MVIDGSNKERVKLNYGINWNQVNTLLITFIIINFYETTVGNIGNLLKQTIEIIFANLTYARLVDFPKR